MMTTPAEQTDTTQASLREATVIVVAAILGLFAVNLSEPVARGIRLGQDVPVRMHGLVFVVSVAALLGCLLAAVIEQSSTLKGFISRRAKASGMRTQAFAERARVAVVIGLSILSIVLVAGLNTVFERMDVRVPALVAGIAAVLLLMGSVILLWRSRQRGRGKGVLLHWGMPLALVALSIFGVVLGMRG